MRLVAQCLRDSATNVALLLPRGSHDFAAFCGVFAQVLKRLRVASERNSRRVDSTTRLDGAVVVIGTNKDVQGRFAAVRIQGVQLDSVLAVHRLTADGRVVDVDGQRKPVKESRDLLLYLNSRAAWPQVTKKGTPGIVVIDGTSFKDSSQLDRALAWTDENRARAVIVVADLGNLDVVAALQASRRTFLCWEWSPTLLRSLPRTKAEASPSISTNALLCPAQAVPVRTSVALCDGSLDAQFKSLIALLREARRFTAGDLPGQIVDVRHIVSGLASCLSSVDGFNREAALDHRTTSMSSTVQRIESAKPSDFAPAWRPFADARWGELKLQACELYRRVLADNPKQRALALLLDKVCHETKCPIVVRVPSNASLLAVSRELELKGFDTTREDSRVTLATVTRRLPWATTEIVEIYPGALSKWQSAVLWSAESTQRIHLVYPYEVAYLRAMAQRESARQHESLSATARSLRFALPAIDSASAIPLHSQWGAPTSSEADALPDLDLNLELLFGPITPRQSPQSTALPPAAGVNATPITLAALPQSRVECWWVRADSMIETVRRGCVQAVEVPDLRPGDDIVVPQGDSRDAVFERFVAALSERGAHRAFNEILGRWRGACFRLHDLGGSWQGAAAMLKREGSKTNTWQSPRMWAFGTVIVPDDAEDIRRVGLLTQDTFLENQHERVFQMGREIRLLRQRIGKVISGAFSDAASGGGPNLQQLSDVIGMDAAELLDEFQLRKVREVGESQMISVHRVGSLEVVS